MKFLRNFIFLLIISVLGGAISSTITFFSLKHAIDKCENNLKYCKNIKKI